MSLRLIYGKSGCGKSEYCFKEIAKNVNIYDCAKPNGVNGRKKIDGKGR